MHALVAAVLLRVARLDALDDDAEPEPEHRQAREIVEAVRRSEREPVVGADGGGQAALPEQPHEGLDDRRLLCRFKRFAGEHIARDLVGDRQGVTVATLPSLNSPLKSVHHRSLGAAACDNGVPTALLARFLLRAWLTRP